MKRLFSGRWATLDPDYGECTVLGSSRVAIAMCGGLALLVLPLLLRATVAVALGGSDQYGTPSNVAAGIGLDLVLWLSAWYLWQTRLLVGERGFKYVRPARFLNQPIQGPWSNVLDVKYAPSLLSGGRLTISFRDPSDGGHGGQTPLPLFAFSAGGSEVCELLNARLAAYRADPVNSQAPSLGTRHRPRRHERP